MLKRVVSVLESICAVCLCILVFSVFYQILARVVLRVPATWTTEVARSMFHIIVFLGMPIIIYEESQMAVTMIKDLFKKSRPATLAFNIIGDIFVYFLLITLIYGSYERTISEWDASVPTIEWMSYGHLYLVMFVGALLMLGAQAARTKHYLTEKDEKEES